MQVIRSAWLPDSHTAELHEHDIVIDGDRIAGVLPSETADPSLPGLDAAGRIGLPGFIDAHSHAEALFNAAGSEVALLRQGLTTVILGQDGISHAPLNSSCARDIENYFLPINGRLQVVPEGEMSIGEVLQTWSRGAQINTSMLVPCGNVRAMVAGFSSHSLTRDELRQVEFIVRRNLEVGAVGISLGLEYVPNRFAGPAELNLYARLAAEYEVPLVAHIRGYEEQAPSGLNEFIALARSSAAPIHVSHLHGPSELILPHVEAALDSGVDITFDSYPYRRGNTTLAMLALPAELQHQGHRATQEALTDPAVRAALVSDHLPTLGDLLTRVTVSSTTNSDWSWTEGTNLVDVAARCGSNVDEVVLDLLRANDCSVGVVVEQPHVNSVADVREIANHRVHMGSTDGIYLGGHPHPRGWGGFARMLRRHVLDWRDWTWGDAAAHLSTRAARRFGLGDRGEVRPGAIADLILVDPDSLEDRASYDHPTTLATGTVDVFVAGHRVLGGGEVADEAPGQAITRTTRSHLP